jgi:hypothetical protein
MTKQKLLHEFIVKLTRQWWIWSNYKYDNTGCMSIDCTCLSEMLPHFIRFSEAVFTASNIASECNCNLRNPQFKRTDDESRLSSGLTFEMCTSTCDPSRPIDCLDVSDECDIDRHRPIVLLNSEKFNVQVIPLFLISTHCQKIGCKRFCRTEFPLFDVAQSSESKWHGYRFIWFFMSNIWCVMNCLCKLVCEIETKIWSPNTSWCVQTIRTQFWLLQSNDAANVNSCWYIQKDPQNSRFAWW